MTRSVAAQHRRNPRRTGQTVAEYALVFAMITAFIVGIQMYTKRSLQATVKMAADRMSPATLGPDPQGERAQLEGMRYESGERTNKVFAVGSSLERFSAARTDATQKVETQVGLREGDVETHVLKDVTKTTGAVANQQNIIDPVAAAKAKSVTNKLQQHRSRFPSLDANAVSAYAETIVRIHSTNPAPASGLTPGVISPGGPVPNPNQPSTQFNPFVSFPSFPRPPQIPPPSSGGQATGGSGN